MDELDGGTGCARWRTQLAQKRQKVYLFYVLVLLMIVYLINQMDRFILGIASRRISSDLEYGNLGCYANDSHRNQTCNDSCITYDDEESCIAVDDHQCTWNYKGTGIQYQILVGPAFTAFFTMAAIPMGFLAGVRRVRRTLFLGVCVVLWSIMSLLSGFTRAFWQLLLARIGLAIFESSCTPFATSLISDYFQSEERGMALGFYNWGVYIGYSLAFAFNFIVEQYSWRTTFIVAGIPGLVVGIIVLATIREPERRRPEGKLRSGKCGTVCLSSAICAFLQPPLVLLFLGGGLRQGGGLVWAYNVKAYFRLHYCDSDVVGSYLSWVPLVGGSLGAVLGGCISDRLVKKRGYGARLWVLIFSQVAAAPFLFGALYLPPPWAFLSLIPAYLTGEMWIGVCLAVVMDLVPVSLTSAAVAIYLFIINNIGGSLNLALPALEGAIGFRSALIILFPGTYLTAAVLFAAALLLIFCREKIGKRRALGEIIRGSTSQEQQGLIQEEHALARSDPEDSEDDEDEESKDRDQMNYDITFTVNRDRERQRALDLQRSRTMSVESFFVV